MTYRVQLVAWLILFFGLSFKAQAQSDSTNLIKIVDQLVYAYNNQNASTYRESFAQKLKDEFTLQDMQIVLSSNMKSKGPIESYSTHLSPDGKRALVILEMEQGTFDVHIRVNDKSQIERLIWFPHKADPTVNTLSGHERHLIQAKYKPYVEKFIQAIRDTSAETVLSLMTEDENDDWKLEDYRSFLTQMNERGLKEVGDIEIIASNEVLIPVFFESVDMGFYLEFDKENKISGLRISNYAPSNTKGLSYTILGADTLKTLDLTSYDQLREAFASDSGKVRFIALLSPT